MNGGIGASASACAGATARCQAAEYINAAIHQSAALLSFIILGAAADVALSVRFFFLLRSIASARRLNGATPSGVCLRYACAHYGFIR